MSGAGCVPAAPGRDVGASPEPTPCRFAGCHHYGDWHIQYDPVPIPSRAFDWHFWHDDYDGAEDANDDRCGSAASEAHAKAEIDWRELES